MKRSNANPVVAPARIRAVPTLLPLARLLLPPVLRLLP